MQADSSGRAAFPDLTPAGGPIQGVQIYPIDALSSTGVLVDLSRLVLAADPFELSTGTQGAVEMQDAPSGDSTAPAATSLVSLYQPSCGAEPMNSSRNENGRTGATAIRPQSSLLPIEVASPRYHIFRRCPRGHRYGDESELSDDVPAMLRRPQHDQIRLQRLPHCGPRSQRIMLGESLGAHCGGSRWKRRRGPGGRTALWVRVNAFDCVDVGRASAIAVRGRALSSSRDARPPRLPQATGQQRVDQPHVLRPPARSGPAVDAARGRPQTS
jgi:hypothetical protein